MIYASGKIGVAEVEFSGLARTGMLPTVAIKILEAAQKKPRLNSVERVAFEYKILTNGCSDFSDGNKPEILAE